MEPNSVVNIPPEWDNYLTVLKDAIVASITNTIKEKLDKITDEEIPQVKNRIKDIESRLSSLDDLVTTNREDIAATDEKVVKN